ncbi:YhgE/Pip domain-containing protein [Rhodococcoides fascians]|uniref:YhgE/Pip domain-containing protein n=1 Tax=Rhodococcoides fascians TaxID=1828 RepID=UPI000A8EAFEA|nr:ABC transporter permease [Rhodococcus fascians]
MKASHSVTNTTALDVLRHPKGWIIPSIVLSIAILAISIVFTGSAANPAADLRDAPIGLVNLDQGATLGEQQMNLGDQVLDGIQQQPTDAVSWQLFDSEDEMRAAFADNALYASIVLPTDFTVKLSSLTGNTPARPDVQVLGNDGAGSVAASIGETIAESAVKAASSYAAGVVASYSPAAIPAANALLVSDPVTISLGDGVDMGARTGNGMTAFFYALLLMMVGFLGANLINGMVDSELGFNPSEIGPRRRVMRPSPISRTQTYLAKAAILAIASLPTSAVILFVGAVVMKLDLPNPFLMWLFGIASIIAIGLGTLTVVTILGSLGIVIGMIFFIGWSIPVSGGAIPLHAMPAFWRFLATFEPMRAVVDGVRAIMYFGASGAAGLERGWILLAIGAALAIAAGIGLNHLYDRRGMHRIHPMALAHIDEFVTRIPQHEDPKAAVH